MKKHLKRYLAYILTGSFSFILAACYGPPVEMGHFVDVNTKDDEGNPIKGLKVEMNLNNGEQTVTEYTDENGQAYLDNIFLEENNEYVVTIEDIDGEDNGGLFQPKEFKIDETSSYDIEME